MHSNVSLNHGVIQLNPLTAQIYGGQGTERHHGHAARSTAYAVNAKLTGVDANKMLSAVSSVKDTFTARWRRPQT